MLLIAKLAERKMTKTVLTNHPALFCLAPKKIATTADSMAQCVPVAVFKVNAVYHKCAMYLLK